MKLALPADLWNGERLAEGTGVGAKLVQVGAGVGLRYWLMWWSVVGLYTRLPQVPSLGAQDRPFPVS